jgi:arabinose-5-phosphate isomerase
MMFLQQARTCLAIEAEAIHALMARIGPAFTDVVQRILQCPGRVVVTGMGKSGIIARKIMATLASTGTPALFLYPAEAIHGDFGMVTRQDIVLALSTSGETPEVVALLPTFTRMGVPIIALCGREASTLGKHAAFFLDVSVEREACPLGLAPTASAVAALAMGDALAVALLTARNFQPENFALFHPGGALGRKLMLVVDLMRSGEDQPVVSSGTPLKDALFVITSKGIGATSVIDRQGKLLGIVTDGDIRRGLANGYNLLDEPVDVLMTRTPRTVTKDRMAAYAIHVMENNRPRPITVLPVVDAEEHVIGMIHLTDLLDMSKV